MRIHVHVFSYIEHEEESVVEEEVVLQTENPPVENNFYFDICGVETETPATQGKPRRIIAFPCCFKIFITLYDALGDRSWSSRALFLASAGDRVCEALLSYAPLEAPPAPPLGAPVARVAV
jgi:hypothetical protein